ncbi:dihydrofolate reductase family protein [Thalassobaculum sp.]|uniref:dihydrofolate reductase family protein n=1 Tax=Thalassobaculum sp. TaxID=2022740 RepID=UPI0032EC7785
MSDACFRLYMAISLDGMIADAEGGVEWLNRWDDVDYGTATFMTEVDVLVMGRATYDQVLGFGQWPYAGKRAFVLTSRPIGDAPEGVEGTSDIAGLVAELRDEGAQVWIVGGAETVSACISMGAIDTVELFVMPVLLGEGVPLFVGDGPELPLVLRENKSWPNGVVGMVYDVA